MKRLVCAFLSLVFILIHSAMPAFAAGVPKFSRSLTYPGFRDVSSDAWYFENVKSACEYGLMVGKDGGSFDPEGNITLAEVITVAARLHRVLTGEKGDFEVSDPWYSVYLRYARDNGFTGGYSFSWEENGKPDGYTSSVAARKADRAAFVRILSEALPDEALAEINPVDDGYIPDVSQYIDDEEREAVYRFYRAGITRGYDASGRFLPDEFIRRCEAAAIITRIADPSLRQSFEMKKNTMNYTHFEMTPEYISTMVKYWSGGKPVLAYVTGDFDFDGTKEGFAVANAMEVWYMEDLRADRVLNNHNPVACANYDPFTTAGSVKSAWDDFGTKRFFHVNLISGRGASVGYALWTVESGVPVRVELPDYAGEDGHSVYYGISFDSDLHGYVVEATLKQFTFRNPDSGIGYGNRVGLNGEDYLQYRLLTYDDAAGEFRWTATKAENGEWIPRG